MFWKFVTFHRHYVACVATVIFVVNEQVNERIEWWIPQFLGPGITVACFGVHFNNNALDTSQDKYARFHSFRSSNWNDFINSHHQADRRRRRRCRCCCFNNRRRHSVRRVYNHFSDATQPLYNISLSRFCLASHVRWHTSIITSNASAMLQFCCVPATIPL